MGDVNDAIMLHDLPYLLRLGIIARCQGWSLEQTLAVGDIPEEFLSSLKEHYPWLVAHLRAICRGESRPSVPVPKIFQSELDGLWRALEESDR